MFDLPTIKSVTKRRMKNAQAQYFTERRIYLRVILQDILNFSYIKYIQSVLEQECLVIRPLFFFTFSPYFCLKALCFIL